MPTKHPPRPLQLQSKIATHLCLIQDFLGSLFDDIRRLPAQLSGLKLETLHLLLLCLPVLCLLIWLYCPVQVIDPLDQLPGTLHAHLEVIVQETPQLAGEGGCRSSAQAVMF